MWMMGFGRKLGACAPLQVELWGIKTSLELALERNMQKAIVECDNMEAIQLILVTSECPNLHYAIDMVQGIKLSLEKAGA